MFYQDKRTVLNNEGREKLSQALALLQENRKGIAVFKSCLEIKT